MALSSWWLGDNLPQLPPVAGFQVEITQNLPLLAQLAQLDEQEVLNRIETGHYPYLAYVQHTPVAYGWVATREANVGELGLTFTVPPANLYLWDFVTLPAWRGRGLYPLLLQAILTAEMKQGVERFWIIAAPENAASTAGIVKAGFGIVGELTFLGRGGVGLLTTSLSEKAKAGATLFNVPLLYGLTSELSAVCWQCVINLSPTCNCLNAGTRLANQNFVCSCIGS